MVERPAVDRFPQMFGRELFPCRLVGDRTTRSLHVTGGSSGPPESWRAMSRATGGSKPPNGHRRVFSQSRRMLIGESEKPCDKFTNGCQLGELSLRHKPDRWSRILLTRRVTFGVFSDSEPTKVGEHLVDPAAEVKICEMNSPSPQNMFTEQPNDAPTRLRC
jgi:hypothetical protein